MRYLVYLMIVANLALFSWQFYRPTPEPPVSRPRPLPDDVRQLALLSERPMTLAQRTGVKGPPVAEVAAASLEPGQQSSAVEPTEHGEAGVDAVSAAKLGEPGESPVEPPPSDEEAPARRICHALGPIDKREDAASIATLVSRHGYEVDTRDEEVRESAGYWVYLPGMHKEQALKIVADLDAHGMTDYYVGKRNYISLGIFSTPDKAKRRQHDVKAIGYEALLEPRFRNRKAYWVAFEERGLSQERAAVLRDVRVRYPDLALESATCE